MAPTDIQYSQALNIQGQIAGATPLSQLFTCTTVCSFGGNRADLDDMEDMEDKENRRTED